jgi:hypothetical protein
MADLRRECHCRSLHRRRRLRVQPWDEPIKGRETIVADWLTDQNAPGSWTAEYRPFVVAGDRAVAIGETRYVDDKVFFNIWQLTFDRDGRCSDFVEWYMTPPNDRQ